MTDYIRYFVASNGERKFYKTCIDGRDATDLDDTAQRYVADLYIVQNHDEKMNVLDAAADENGFADIDDFGARWVSAAGIFYDVVIKT